MFPVTSLWKDSRDEILLRLTRTVAQFVCLSGVVGSDAGFSEWRYTRCPTVRRQVAKFGSSSMACLKNGIAAVDPVVSETLITGAESFKGLKRRRGGLFKRGIKLLYGAQRLAQFVANFRSCLSQSIEHMVLVARLSFRARQRFTA